MALVNAVEQHKEVDELPAEVWYLNAVLRFVGTEVQFVDAVILYSGSEVQILVVEVLWVGTVVLLSDAEGLCAVAVAVVLYSEAEAGLLHLCVYVLDMVAEVLPLEFLKVRYQELYADAQIPHLKAADLPVNAVELFLHAEE